MHNKPQKKKVSYWVDNGGVDGIKKSVELGEEYQDSGNYLE